MADSDVDALFLRFQRSGDPAALAAVYDQVAPELLLVAAHFATTAAAAEDLVQSTFLAAIESAAAYDPTRRVVPWLVGILANQARRARRTDARRLDAARMEPPAAADPLRAAAGAEFTEELAHRLQTLPPHYRQILILRWTHGLQPLEIAHALGLPPATVKTRLRRGQEILLQALPAGFAALLLAGTARGLAGVRASVLERAAAAAAGRAAPVSRVLRPAHAGKALAIAGLAVVGQCLLLFLDGPDPPPRSVAAAPVVPAATRAALDGLARGTVPAAAERGTAGTAAAGPEFAAADLAVRIRYSDGTPGADVVVRASPQALADPLFRERLVTADGAGVATFRALDTGPWRIAADRGGAVDVVAGAAGAAVATLTIPAGVDLIGRVVDGEAPVAGARVWLSREDARDEGATAATTGADGRFLLRSVAPERLLYAVADGYRPSPVEPVGGIPGERRERTIDLADRRDPVTLEGRVLDEDGNPVAGARVQVGKRLKSLDFGKSAISQLQRLPPRDVATDADGRYRVDDFVQVYVAVPVFARAPGYAPACAEIFFNRPEERFDFVLQRGLAVEGTVRAETGAPLAGVAIQAWPPGVPDPDVAPRWAELVAFSGADGRFRLEGVPPGPGTLAAVAGDGRRASAELDAREGTRWDAVLFPPRVLRGRVVDANQSPLAGLAVAALPPAGRVAPASVRTDAAGAFQIEGCEDFDYQLAVEQPGTDWAGYVAATAGIRPAPGGAPVVVLTVPEHRLATARLRGRFVDTEGRPLGGRIILDALCPGAALGLADPATGRFELGPLPPLRPGYRLYGVTSSNTIVEREPLELEPRQVLDLGDVRAAAPGACTVACSLADGTPVAHGKLWFGHEGHSAATWQYSDVTGGRGTTFEGLAPGRYRTWLEAEGLAPAPTDVEVRSGATAELKVVTERAALIRVQLEHPADGSETAVNLEWRDGSGEVLWRERLRRAGGALLRAERWLAPGAYELRAESHTGRSGALRVQVGGPGSTPQDLRLELVPPP